MNITMYMSIFLLLTSAIISVKSGCYHSYMTFCDDIADIRSENVESWHELVIGAADKAENKHVIGFNSIELDRFERLTTLIIIGQVREIKSNTFYISSGKSKLETVNFYGNDIRILKHNSFDSMHLRRLVFHNNNLEYVQRNAFYQCEFETIDMSDNKLDQIEHGIFSDKLLSNTIKELILRNNRISSVERHSLPIRLEILNLDHNRIEFLAHDIFVEPTGLLEVTISYNKLKSVPNLAPLKDIRVVDLSHNQIAYVNVKYLDDLNAIEVLDLSYNQIYQANLLSHFAFPKRGLVLQVSLAFNHFTQMALYNESLANHIIIFYGNPWVCKCWEKIDKFIVANHVKRHKCDLEFFGSGQTPYCIYYENSAQVDCDDKQLKKPQFTDKELKDFLQVIDDDKKNIVCNLGPRKL